MGWRFRRTKKIAPGIRLNFSKSGISTTVGKRGASVNFGNRGTFLNLGIPGTGIYSREKISTGKKAVRGADDSAYSDSHRGGMGCIVKAIGALGLINTFAMPFIETSWTNENVNVYALSTSFALLGVVFPVICSIISKGQSEGVINTDSIANGCLSWTSLFGGLIKFFGCYSLVQVFLIPIMSLASKDYIFNWKSSFLLYLFYVICALLIIIIPFLCFLKDIKSAETIDYNVSTSESPTPAYQPSPLTSSLYIPSTTQVSHPNIDDFLILRIAQFLVKRQVVSMQLIQSEFNLDTSTAYSALSKLEKLRVISEDNGLTPRKVLVRNPDDLKNIFNIHIK